MSRDDSFELFDLRVDVVIPEEGPFIAGQNPETISN